MHSFFTFLQNKKKRFPLSDYIYRLIAAYMSCLLFFLLRSDYALTDFSFFMEIPVLGLVGGVLLLFLFSCLLPGQAWVRIVIFGEGLIYCLFAILQQNNYYFLFGCMGVIAFFIFYSDITDISFRLPLWSLWVGSILLFLLVTASVAIYMILRYRNNMGSCFDLGIFTQMYHYMKETGLPLTTCERDGLLSHFAVHISPIFYLLLPFYALVPKFETVLAGHAIFTYTGFLPLTLICRKRRLTPAATLAFNLCYMLAPAFAGGYDYFIHENCFLPPLILWLFFFLEWEKESSGSLPFALGKKFLCVISAFLLLLVKEDAAIYVCCISLFFLVNAIAENLKTPKWKQMLLSPALWIFVLAIVYFIAAVTILSSASDTQVSIRYSNYIYDGSNRLSVMLLAVLKNPFYVLSQILSAEKLELLAYVIIALGFLPFLSRKISGWILLIPLLLFNLMSDYGYQSNIHFQYVYGSMAFLICLSVYNYSEMEGKLRRKFLLLASSGSILIFGFLFGSHADFYKNWQLDSSYREACEEAQNLVPEDASVAANTFLVPTWSDRDVIYELETTSNRAEYYVLDLRGGSTEYLSYESDSDYEEIYFSENAIAVYHYLAYDPASPNPKKTFSDTVHSMKTDLENEIQNQLSSVSVDDLGDLQVSGVTFTRVYADQGWGSSSPDGTAEGVYMVDSYGNLVYLSYRDSSYCATWSGPTEDEDFITSMGGWNNGQGFGWTGTGI